MSIWQWLRQRASRPAASAAAGVSTDYQPLPDAQAPAAGRQLRDSWKDASIPERQRAIVDPQLNAYRKGAPVPVFDALVEILKSNIPGLAGQTVLEIGCSSGYYSEVFTIKKLGVHYEGCDYSAAFIDLARQRYPGIAFGVQDATELRYADTSYNIVLSGGCILHIPDYECAIAEAARVSRRWVVFHRTPVLAMHGPMSYTKKAYGVDTIEIHFNEQALVRLFARHDMRVVDVNTHAIGWEAEISDALAMKTYLCVKNA